MKALKSTGLVPVTVREGFRNYQAGDMVRFSPADAQKFLEAGLVAEASLPKGTGTIAVALPPPAMVSDKILPQELPAIPDDWEARHRLQRIKLAEQITGHPVKPEEADKVIMAELARRLTE